MKKVLLAVTFKGSHNPLNLVLNDGEAHNLLRAFVSGAKTGYASGHIPEEDFHWAFEWNQVACMYAQNLEILQQRQLQAQQQQMQGQPSVPPNGWGRNKGGSGGTN